jgi:hypothetical protein
MFQLITTVRSGSVAVLEGILCDVCDGGGNGHILAAATGCAAAVYSLYRKTNKHISKS